MDYPSSKYSGKGLLSIKSIFAIGLILLVVSQNFFGEVTWLSYVSYFIMVSGFLGSAYQDWKQGDRAEARSKVFSLTFVLVVFLIANLIIRS